MSNPETTPVDPASMFGQSAPAGPQYERRKLKDNEPSKPFRIFPPMHSLMSDKNGSFVYCAQHFGYQGKDPKNPTKLKMRPFVCIEDKDPKTKMTIVSCPQCRLIEKQKAALKDLKDGVDKKLAEKGIKDPAQIKAFSEPILKPLMDWADRYNLDNKVYVNTIELDGTFALYQIPHKAKLAIDQKCAELRSQGIEPINDFGSGVYFVLQRHGNWNNATFTATVLEEQVGNTKGLMQKKFAPLSRETLLAALKNLPDLGKLGTTLSKEQIQMLVDCGGSAEEVDSIFSLTKRPDRERSPSTLPPAQEMKLPDTVQAQAPAAPPATAPAPVLPAAMTASAPVTPPAAAQVPVTPAIDPEEAALAAEMEALKARMAAKKAAQAQPQPATAPVSTPQAQPAAPAVPQVDFRDPNLTPEQFASLFPKLER